MSRVKHPIPSRGFVRAMGVVILGINVFLVVVAVMNFQALGWIAWGIIAGCLATIYFPIKAIRTGDPEWILLDLIMPL